MANLKRCVSLVLMDGKWRDLKYGQKQFRTTMAAS